MLKKGLFATLIALSGVFLFVAYTGLAAQEKTGGKEVTITGHVVDPACYISMGLKGEQHKQCAVLCAKAGQAFGILDEKAGILYQVLEGSPGADPNKLLWDHAESKVTVKGIVFNKNGMHAIVPTEVKPAGS